MTVITLTTVGFREVRELVDWPERLWTMLVSIAGVGIIYGSIGTVAEAPEEFACYLSSYLTMNRGRGLVNAEARS